MAWSSIHNQIFKAHLLAMLPNVNDSPTANPAETLEKFRDKLRGWYYNKSNSLYDLVQLDRLKLISNEIQIRRDELNKNNDIARSNAIKFYLTKELPLMNDIPVYDIKQSFGAFKDNLDKWAAGKNDILRNLTSRNSIGSIKGDIDKKKNEINDIYNKSLDNSKQLATDSLLKELPNVDDPPVPNPSETFDIFKSNLDKWYNYKNSLLNTLESKDSNSLIKDKIKNKREELTLKADDTLKQVAEKAAEVKRVADKAIRVAEEAAAKEALSRKANNNARAKKAADEAAAAAAAAAKKAAEEAAAAAAAAKKANNNARAKKAAEEAAAAAAVKEAEAKRVAEEAATAAAAAKKANNNARVKKEIEEAAAKEAEAKRAAEEAIKAALNNDKENLKKLIDNADKLFNDAKDKRNQAIKAKENATSINNDFVKISEELNKLSIKAKIIENNSKVAIANEEQANKIAIDAEKAASDAKENVNKAQIDFANKYQQKNSPAILLKNIAAANSSKNISTIKGGSRRNRRNTYNKRRRGSGTRRH